MERLYPWQPSFQTETGFNSEYNGINMGGVSTGSRPVIYCETTVASDCESVFNGACIYPLIYLLYVIDTDGEGL